jgi:hypothetical protein
LPDGEPVCPEPAGTRTQAVPAALGVVPRLQCSGLAISPAPPDGDVVAPDPLRMHAVPAAFGAVRARQWSGLDTQRAPVSSAVFPRGQRTQAAGLLELLMKSGPFAEQSVGFRTGRTNDGRVIIFSTHFPSCGALPSGHAQSPST